MSEPTKTKKRRKMRPSLKRTKLLRGIASGMNVSEAGRAAGYGRAQSAHNAFNTYKLRVTDAATKLGITPESILKKFLDKMEAKETKFFADKGIVMETREVVAHDIQLRSAIELASLLDLYPDRNSHRDDGGSKSAGATIIFNLGFLDPSRAEAVLSATGESVSGSDRRCLPMADPSDQDAG